jgi:hypothetical protein
MLELDGRQDRLHPSRLRTNKERDNASRIVKQNRFSRDIKSHLNLRFMPPEYPLLSLFLSNSFSPTSASILDAASFTSSLGTPLIDAYSSTCSTPVRFMKCASNCGQYLRWRGRNKPFVNVRLFKGQNTKLENDTSPTTCSPSPSPSLFRFASHTETSKCCITTGNKNK